MYVCNWLGLSDAYRSLASNVVRYKPDEKLIILLATGSSVAVLCATPIYAAMSTLVFQHVVCWLLAYEEVFGLIPAQDFFLSIQYT